MVAGVPLGGGLVAVVRQFLLVTGLPTAFIKDVMQLEVDGGSCQCSFKSKLTGAGSTLCTAGPCPYFFTRWTGGLRSSNRTPRACGGPWLMPVLNLSTACGIPAETPPLNFIGFTGSGSVGGAGKKPSCSPGIRKGKTFCPDNAFASNAPGTISPRCISWYNWFSIQGLVSSSFLLGDMLLSILTKSSFDRAAGSRHFGR
mmetsp:Transcript_74218/g.154787  ORF Transcript_74218/g.154787 Transcript_74218/m.154787 type:complete len:200 (-) Transcript_74218:1209-1808(-)